MNNFKMLEEELAKGKEKKFQEVRNNINDSRSLFQTIGDIVDLFFPKFVEVFVKMTGKEEKRDPQSKYPHENN